MKRYALAAVAVMVALGAGFAAGRFLAPARVETRYVDRVVTVEVARRVEVAGPVRIVTRTVERPGETPTCPPIRETTVTEERGPVTTTTDTARTEERESTSTKTVERIRPRFRVEVSQDVTRLTDPSALGGAASVRVLGPVWLGAAAAAKDPKHPRLTLGVEF